MSIDNISNTISNRVDINAALSHIGKNRSSSEIGQKKPRPVEKADIKYPEAKRLSQDEAIEAIQKANKEFIAYDRRFEFSIHEKTRQIMVKVIDVNNNEVIRELPPEKILDMVAAIWEIAGIIVDKKI